jgi:two-component system sensor histidine kinase/response regulator
MLKNFGFECDIANDGIEAVNICNTSTFDIIFMDIQMPNLDGYDATKQIRSNGITTPIIALSAAAMQKDKENAKNSGMDEHLCKPIIKADLENIIKHYFTTKYTTTQTSNPQWIIPHIEKLGIESLLNNFNHDEQKVITLYINFTNKYKDTSYIQEIVSNSKEFKSYIHKLKGVSGNLRIDSVYQLCHEIEKEENDTELVSQLIVEINEVCKIIDKQLVPLKKSQENFSTEELLEEAQKLFDATQNYSFIESSRIDTFINSLEGLISNEQIEQLQISFNSHAHEMITDNLKTVIQVLKG